MGMAPKSDARLLWSRGHPTKWFSHNTRTALRRLGSVRVPQNRSLHSLGRRDAVGLATEEATDLFFGALFSHSRSARLVSSEQIAGNVSRFDPVRSSNSTHFLREVMHPGTRSRRLVQHSI